MPWVGQIGEIAVASALIAQHFDVYVPVFGTGMVDLVAMRYGFHPIRVEVKATSHKSSKGVRSQASWKVNLCRRSNVSDGQTRFRGTLSDVLAVYLIETNSVVFYNSADLDGRATLITTDDPERYDVAALGLRAV